VKNSKFINAQTMSNISFMRSCVVELLSINFVESYQRAFEFLRQISLHVRVAFTSKQKSMDMAMTCC
jgi:nucleolar complex protein 2